MGTDISREKLCEKIKSQFKESAIISTNVIKKRKAYFISELKTFCSIYADTEKKSALISDIIEICKTMPKEIFLLKIFSDINYAGYNDFKKCDYIVLFNKIYSILLNSSGLTTQEKLVCINFQRYLMRLYSKTLV